MTLNSNQFMQGVEVGFCDRNTCCYNPIPVVVASTQATAIGVGEPVALANVTSSPISQIVAAAAGDGGAAESVFGLTFIRTHKNQVGAYDRTEILPLGSGAIVYLAADAAITAGALVSYVVADKKVKTAVSGDQVVGQALVGAAAQGDLIPVYLNQPFGTNVA